MPAADSNMVSCGSQLADSGNHQEIEDDIGLMIFLPHPHQNETVSRETFWLTKKTPFF